ncbi:MAG TPA: acetyl-CoA carboxylase biotin carboxyl carrier protein, partial [bacterium]|nr:acetyl-CoA carboxylase biotin carboxyl carrier protein [bacterium]
QRFDLEEIRALIRLAAEADIAELEVEGAHVKVRIKKAHDQAAAPVTWSAPGAAAPAARAGTEAHAEEAHATAAERRYTPIVAPMVGTFYRAPKPDAAPFVQEGDTIEQGQTVCILEAMKLFNEIPSETAGRIVRILVENGAPVEYGQPLFLLDPSPVA